MRSPRSFPLRRWLLLVAFIGALGTAMVADCLRAVHGASAGIIHTAVQDVPAAFTAIVLGCRVNGDDPSRCLEERLIAALELHRSGRVHRLLLSGDHGTQGYDEVNTMKDWLVARGVPEAHVFLDHAGFDTYDSMVRARKVFQVDDAVIVSQHFHLPRALYLAHAAGLQASALAADPPQGSACRGSAVREPLACVKAVLDARLALEPRFLGPAIPVQGDPAVSFDRPAASVR